MSVRYWACTSRLWVILRLSSLDDVPPHITSYSRHSLTSSSSPKSSHVTRAALAEIISESVQDPEVQRDYNRDLHRRCTVGSPTPDHTMAQRPDIKVENGAKDAASTNLAKQWIQQRYEDTSRVIFHEQLEQEKLEKAVIRRRPQIPNSTNWYRNYGNTAMYVVSQLPNRSSSRASHRSSTVKPT